MQHSLTSFTCNSILIAEDNDDIRETIADALKSEGYAVYTSKNGKEALEQLELIPSPALVLLDLMMPVMNGWEFLDVTKQKDLFPRHKVVTLSAVPATESLEDQTPLLTEGRLHKPIVLETLLATVKMHCAATLLA